MADDSPEVLGPYTIYELLGRGGMATVNRAEMRGAAGFRKVVALKRLHAHIAHERDMVSSFVYEARLASHLRHPNVAQTYDLGKVDGTYFIAMEYIEGPTLAQLLKQAAEAAGPVPIPIAVALLGQICDALDYAHNLCDPKGRPLGIIHRDVSPSNIIVSSTGVAKLIDFGIAKAAGSDKTKAGLVKGKFGYMAPEYLEGQLDLRADLFGLGVIAHELLTGRRLFQGKTDFDTLMRLRELPIQPPSRWNPDVPRDLDDIVQTALQRNPALRWQSAAAMRTAITNVMQELGPVTNQQVSDWVDWAFAQLPPEEDTKLGRVIDSLGEPTKVPRPGAAAAMVAGAPRAGAGAGGAAGAGAGSSRPRLPGVADPEMMSEPRTRLERPTGKRAAQAAPADAGRAASAGKVAQPSAGQAAKGSAARPAQPSAGQAAKASAARSPRAGAAKAEAEEQPRRAGRTWRLLLVLAILGALARDQLVDAGRMLYAQLAG